jgi:hypothetical protein
LLAGGLRLGPGRLLALLVFVALCGLATRLRPVTRLRLPGLLLS